MAKSNRKLNISKALFSNADYKAAHAENDKLFTGINLEATRDEYDAAHAENNGGEPSPDTSTEQSDDTSEPMLPAGWDVFDTSTEQPVQTSALVEDVIQEITATPTAKAPRVYSNRTETRVQLYPFANLSIPDGAYLRFWSSFADNANPVHVVTFDTIRRRCVHIAGRNPHPAAGGKNGCTDHARSKRLYEAGFINPVTDGHVRVGFTFTDKARASRDYHLGLADEYCPETGRLLVLAS